MNILYDEHLDGPLPKVDKQALLQALQAQVPDLDILHLEEDLKPYECDGLSAYRSTPLLVVLPRRVEQVQALLKLCHGQNVPVVARVPGPVCPAAPCPGKRRVAGDGAVQPDPAHRPRRPHRAASARVRNLAISQAAAPFGLYYAPDPRRRSPAPSAAMSRKTPAACTASSMA